MAIYIRFSDFEYAAGSGKKEIPLISLTPKLAYDADVNILPANYA